METRSKRRNEGQGRTVKIGAEGGEGSGRGKRAISLHRRVKGGRRELPRTYPRTTKGKGQKVSRASEAVKGKVEC